MNIMISENLKDLRKKKNNTQEDLAEFLTVSITAVSKWERGECYPDIELLPKIAAYYDVSVDDLLGVSAIKKKERIKEYEDKSTHLWSIGDIKSYLPLWREAQKEFPNEWTVLDGLMSALYDFSKRNGKVKENSQEIIELGEKILTQCTNNQYRSNAIRVLCFVYAMLGDKEKAKEYANMIPNYRTTNNEILKYILEGDEAAEHCQINMRNLADLLGMNIIFYIRKIDGINVGEKKLAYHKALKVYELIYEDGDFDYRADRLSEIYRCLSVISAEQQNKDETLEYLTNAVKYDIILDTQEGASKHTSLLINRLSIDWEMGKNVMSNQSYQTLKEMEDNKHYDFCRDDERFIKLIEDLKKVAVSG